MQTFNNEEYILEVIIIIWWNKEFIFLKEAGNILAHPGSSADAGNNSSRDKDVTWASGKK